MTPKTSKDTIFVAIAFFIATALLYYITRSLSLDDVDSVNYALGIGNYNLSLHQPHPPGAPIYVFLAKCLHLMGASPENALTIIACLGGGLFVAAWFCIFTAYFGFSTSVISSIAIAFLPGIWMTSTKPMSDSLAAAFIALALLFAIRFFQRENDLYLFLFPFFGALATGVRPQFGPLALLIIAIVLFYSRSNFTNWFKVFGIFAVACLLWFFPLIYSQSILDNGRHDFLNYFEQLGRFGNRIGNISEWSLGAGELSLIRILKKIFIHLAGCFYLSLGLNIWYPESINLFLAKFGTNLHPWNPDIAEWSISGTLFSILYVAGVFFYIRSAPWKKANHLSFWKINLLWPIFHFFMMVYAVPPSNRQYLPILPILILPAISGWQNFQKTKIMSILITALIVANSAPLAYQNHFEAAPPVALIHFLEDLLKEEERQKALVIMNSSSGRHAEWYLKDIKTASQIGKNELHENLDNGLVFTTRKRYFDKNYSYLELKEIKRFQRSIRIWNRHNRLVLFRVKDNNNFD